MTKDQEDRLVQLLAEAHVMGVDIKALIGRHIEEVAQAIAGAVMGQIEITPRLN
jgi:hypothetical protein